MSWRDELQPASFNGVPFAVLGDEGRFGRRVAVHEYPNRDTPWVEDLGRATRHLSLNGFLVENSLVYGGGSVLAQRDALVAAAESPGPYTLVHPTLGRLTVSLPDDGLTLTEKWDAGRYIAIRLTVIEAGLRVFPVASVAAVSQLTACATTTNAAASQDFITALMTDVTLGLGIVHGVLSLGHAVVGAVVGVTADVQVMAGQIARDATSLFNLASLLTGDFGRYANANVSSAYVASQTSSGSAWTMRTLSAQGAADRAAVQAASDALSGAAAALDEATVAALPLAVQGLVNTLMAIMPNPGDAMARLTALVTYDPTAVPGSGRLADGMRLAQNATAALVRRMALAFLGQAAGSYAPSSYDDAVTARDTVRDLFDSECLLAADAGDDASYTALRDEREAAVQALTVSGGTLARLREWQFQASLPALVLAQRCYQDPTRTDELVSQAHPIHPAFMPVRFQALAA